MKFLILLLFTFLYIFGPVFNPIGSWIDMTFFTSIFLTLYGTLILRHSIPSYFKVFSILIFVFLFVSISILDYHGTQMGDYIINLLKPIRILITMYGGYIICLLLNKYYHNNAIIYALSFVFISIFLHASLMSYQLLNPDFKDFVYKYTSSGEFRSSYDYNFRMGGLSGGPGGAVLSVVQSLGIVISVFLYKKVNKVSKLFIIIGSLLIFFSVLICGRSGLWSILVFFAAFYLLIK
ncbi:MAG: hypothetical protein IPQ18_08330 [Saprospiraceae bacterium]|nr:hypothetical protein [Saprospiraceae bacterium]